MALSRTERSSIQKIISTRMSSSVRSYSTCNFSSYGEGCTEVAGENREGSSVEKVIPDSLGGVASLGTA
ncbi:hypothetical protein HS088_TW06G00390 [Tripterygium wilfordii]|uniref:Uncharacterized protein n=1 Tax=Tripterygium wilfordii TaxID=458696 RepID=A0A7J7DIT2_TRIWF|nr:hypothetical protein HS088_TW06G00390 [Tripterygium wilfordii]